MSMPLLPARTQAQAITDILESIALEEAGLAHIINAEGEKVQAIREGMESDRYNADEALELQRGVARVMRAAIKMQMLLQFKLEEILAALGGMDD